MTTTADQYPQVVAVIDIVIADDALLVREGVRRVLDGYDDLRVVAAVGDLDALLAVVDDTRPSVVVTDIRMPPTSTDEGIRAAAILRERSPGTGVVVLSQYSAPAYALDLLSQGSAGRAYLLKERVSEPEQLVEAIRAVATGGSVVDPLVVESLVTRARSVDDPLQALTPRERDVLGEIAQGKSNAAVAAGLVLTERAVEKHINSLFAKLGLTHEPDIHRRVRAVLLYLSATRSADGPGDRAE